MKHIKSIKTLQNKPQVKDWVIVTTSTLHYYKPNFITFINNSIGYIWKKPTNTYFLVKYFNIPKNILDEFSYSDYSDGLKVGNSILVPLIDIKHFSPNKEDLEHYINANKYNI